MIVGAIVGNKVGCGISLQYGKKKVRRLIQHALCEG